MSEPTGRKPARVFAGFALAIASLAIPAEGFLRRFPPADLAPYLGEGSPLSGIYRPDDDFVAGYSSWEAFLQYSRMALEPWLPLAAHSAGTWAFFGNSFVQAPGMLADTMRALESEHRIFNLGRNEPLFVRMAQIELLLAHGFRPDRIFFLLTTVDLTGIGPQPLDTVHVSSRGALLSEPSLPPGPAGWVVGRSTLAMAAWARTGRHHGNPAFDRSVLDRRIDERLWSDLRRLFAALAKVTAASGVPVTVVLLPSHQQVMRGGDDGFQRIMRALLEPLGYDVFDPRETLLGQPDHAALFIPDKHLSPLGNRLLATALRAHASPRTAAESPAP